MKSYEKGNDVDREHLKLTRQVLQGEVINLHADYLSRRQSLRDACADMHAVAARSSDAMTRAGIGAAVAVAGLLGARALTAARVSR